MEKNRDHTSPTHSMAAAEMFLKPVLQKPPGYHELHAPPETPNALSSSSTLRRRPPKFMIPPSFYPDKKKKWSRCRVFCCCFCITVAILILLLIIAVSVFFLWYSPRLPVVRLASFRVSNFNFSNGKPRDGLSHLTAEASARLDFRNPNGKLRYYYGDADVAVSVGDGDYETSLGSTEVKGFMQKPGNRTVVIVPVKVKREEVDDPTVKMLLAEMKSKKLVVKVTAKTKLGLAVGRRKILTVGITLRCGGVTLQKVDKQMAKCTIKMLKWYVQLLLP
ncbi:NDR1/HIN1-like protein 6 isoform X1 [Brassica napus]|uniref:NDR1/HIN1-like protein 6 isoform X1 n=1 Tax=Brassica napus TaxID=3708 RepID=UPI002078A464|nr:NDR1/HIN1-like protein 6 isoform X1 [Brassica napus]